MVDEPNREATTEEEILSRHVDMAIEAQDAEGEQSEGQAATTDDQGQGDAQQGQQAAEQNAQQQPGDTQDSQSGQGDATAPGQQQQQGQQQSPRGPESITLPDGTVIQGGAERRLWGQLQSERTNVQNLTTQVRDLSTRLQEAERNSEAYHAANTIGTQLGLLPEEQVQAARLMAQYKTNPIATMQFMLAQAQENGHNVAAIAQGFDGNAINQLIRNLTAPIAGQGQQQQQPNASQQQQTNDELNTHAAQQAEQFFASFPDAKLHETYIARMVMDYPGMDPYAAYESLRAAVNERGLDWNAPLAPQLAASAQQADQQQQQNQQGGASANAGHQPPNLPQGRGNTGNAVTNTPTVAHESDHYDDIVKTAMKESGYRIN